MFQNNLLMGADAATSGTSLVSVANSALYESANSEYLSRTPGSASNRDTWTFSHWVYKAYISGAKQFFGAGANNTNNTELRDQGTGILEYRHQDGGSITDNIVTTPIFRDIGWYHIVWAVDTTQAVESNRVIIYVNGVRITALATTNYPAQNVDTDVNDAVATNVGARTGPDHFWSGYMAETVLIDGLQLTPTSFGEFDSTGLYWTPKSSASIKELTFGTNGFYLDNTTNAETDASGEGNNFTNNNTVTTVDYHTPTKLALLVNPLFPATATTTYLDGNTQFKTSATSQFTMKRIPTTLTLPDTGKWILGFNVAAGNVSGKGFGLTNAADFAAGRLGFPGSGVGYPYLGYHQTSGTALWSEAGMISSAMDTGLQTADEYYIAVDLDNTKAYGGFWDNSASTLTWYAADGGTDGDPAAGSNPTNTVDYTGGSQFTMCTISNQIMGLIEEADISITIPTGFSYFSPTNVFAETTRTASDTTKYFDTILYEGNGGGQRVGQFQPFDNSFTVAYSGLFNLVSTGQDTNNAWLTRSQDAGASQKKFTFSFWFKMSDVSLGTSHYIWADDAAGYSGIYFNDAEKLAFISYLSSTQMTVVTDRVFQDPSQWYHAVLAVDTAQSTALERVRIYINGVEEAVTVTNQVPQDSVLMSVGDANGISVGAFISSSPPRLPYDGYLAEFVYINNVQLTPSSFGQTDTSTNRWIPKDVSGLTYDATGYYLNFAGATSDLGDDASGNSNDFTNNNNNALRVTDSPTTNWNVIGNTTFSAGTLSNGNRNLITGSSEYGPALGTLGIDSGKWYWEIKPTASSTATMYTLIGVSRGINLSTTNNLGYQVGDYGYYSYDGDIVTNNNSSGESYGASYAVDDIIGVALDLDNKTLTYYKNNSSQGVITGLLDGLYYSAMGDWNNSGTTTFEARYDSSLWSYSAPTGYSALAQDNMTSSDQFTTALAWIKNRDAADANWWTDRVRGATKAIYSNGTPAETTYIEMVQRFLSGGVQIGDYSQVNTSNESFVLWNWMMEATGSGSSNTDGSINTTSTLVDTTLGMSISTYDGTGANATVGHGLGVAPEFIIIKKTSASGSGWYCYHVGNDATAPQNKVIYLNTTGAVADDVSYWNDTAPTSSVFTISTTTNVNGSGVTYVAYCFAPSQFISLGSYLGNGNADGAFVPILNSLGVPIQPTYFMVKASSRTSPWTIYDTTRLPYNVNGVAQEANSSAAEAVHSAAILDFDTGGMKMRGSSYYLNQNAATYIYLAIGTPIIDTDGRIIAGF